jgi:hypothetical protein
MNYISKTTSVVNPNGGGPPLVHGRGVRRRKMNAQQRAVLAADLVTSERWLKPSLAQVCEIIGTTPALVRTELKARIARKQDTEKDAAADLVEAWVNTSQLEREVAVRCIGPAVVWEVLSKVVA